MEVGEEGDYSCIKVGSDGKREIIYYILLS